MERKREFAGLDRRKRKDWVVRAVNIIAVIGFLTAIASVCFFYVATPSEENFITRYRGYSVTSTWDIDMLRLAPVMLIGVLAICIVGFLFNMARHRRKSDKYSKPILVMGCVAIVGLIAFSIAFGPVLF